MAQRERDRTEGTATSRATGPSLVARVWWCALLAVHAAAGVEAWRLLPHGFAWGSARVVSNSLVPAALVVATLAALVATLRARFGPLRVVAPALAAGWLGLALGAGLLFPLSAGRARMCVLAFAALLGLVATWRLLRPSRGALVLGATTGALLGFVTAFAQRAPAPSTRPLDAHDLPDVAWIDPNSASPPGPVTIGSVTVHDATGTVSARCGGLTLEIEPLLTFGIRALDRGWALAAPFARPSASWRRLTGFALEAYGGVALRYADEDEQWLFARTDPGLQRVTLEAHARVARAVYAHLDSFTTITVVGHRVPALAFSPCPSTRVVVAPSDYPTGRPVTFAFTDAAGEFHVVRARDAEKGPFTELDHGRLPRGRPLGITLFDDTSPACRVTFDDWSAQVSTEPSPTAGWGVPQNAIEFFRDAEDDRSPIRLVLTLASTSVGRGFDSVGHAPGTYRNRVHVQPLR